MLLLNNNSIVVVVCVYHVELTTQDLILTRLAFKLGPEEAFKRLEWTN